MNLSQNFTEKQIMPSKATINWLFNDIWCYLFIACFNWKIDVSEQTVVRVYYILKHWIQDTLTAICNCGEDNETSSHYPLHCPFSLQKKVTLLNSVKHIDSNVLERNKAQLFTTLTHGKKFFDEMNYSSILEATVKYLIEIRKFDVDIFWGSLNVMVYNITLLFKFFL